MAYNLLRWERDQSYLMPPSIDSDSRLLIQVRLGFKVAFLQTKEVKQRQVSFLGAFFALWE